MKKTTANYLLLMACVISTLLTGCYKREKQKVVAEATQAKVEVVKLKAEIVKLKGEISYLNEKLQTADLEKNKIRQQLDGMLEDRESIATEADDTLEQNEKLTAMLAEQVKKTDEIQRQADQLKAVIRELQKRIEPNQPPEPKEEQQLQSP